MIPGKIFTSFAKFQGIVSVNDLGFLFGTKNFFKLLWVSCEVFVLHGYAWIFINGDWILSQSRTMSLRRDDLMAIVMGRLKHKYNTLLLII